jgi:inorganic pyrophosphatase
MVLTAMDEVEDQVFWEALDTLVRESNVIIDRPKGSMHPGFSSGRTYPVDYGYLKNTTSMDGGGIDAWCGSSPQLTINGIICTVDLLKRDSEIKILIGCTPEEMKLALDFYNQGSFMKAILIVRR